MEHLLGIFDVSNLVGATKVIPLTCKAMAFWDVLSQGKQKQ